MTVFILHYRDDAVTERCIQSCIGQDEIIVIDNGSPVPFRTEQDAQVIYLGENMHLIPAFNKAMQLAPSSFYYCLNNDTIATPGMIQRLNEALGDPKVGVVAPGSSDQGAGVLYVPYPSEAWADVVTQHVDNHAWGFTHDVIEEIGYPDAEGHPHRANWYANRLYCWKARQAGYKVVAVRSAYIEHIHAGGYDAEADKAGYEWICQRLGDRVGEAL